MFNPGAHTLHGGSVSGCNAYDGDGSGGLHDEYDINERDRKRIMIIGGVVLFAKKFTEAHGEDTGIRF